MSRLLIGVILFLSFQTSFSQKTSKNNFTGAWESAASWVGGVAPANFDIGAADLDLTINGYITRTGNLTFANINADASGPNLFINDTLVINGSATFENKAANLVLGPNAVFIVFGDFSATNKVTVQNGGIFVVAGDMNFSASGQDEYENPGGGELFVGGTVSGNTDAGGDNDWGNLDDLYPDISDFVQCGGACSLPIRLLFFESHLLGESIELRWATTMEENFDKFIIERSSDGLQFSEVGQVKGAGRNINEIVTNYRFEDLYPLTGFNYYRLKAVDLDLQSDYSRIILAKVDEAKKFWVHPNPVNGPIHYFTNFNPSEGDRVVLYNQLGRPLLDIAAHNHNESLELDRELPSGIYILKYHTAGGQFATRVLVK